ncbi:unnamed protein product [Oppiella nova]|uniref:Uncharacterized protein n=1 Tax=Oppiella nova TaxID=334625 RepID=A0A7R9QQ64_9ACAR|nr:unnamed protein product [Oppiella nova]CAG2170954.1 unnamed protein product [Oppiella nova]
MNGITYASECVSLSHAVPVDYYSNCNHTHSCHHIQCPQQPLCPQHFQHILDNNCCPFCGSVAKLQYDTNAINAIDGQQKSNYAVTVEEMAKHLSHLIRLFGCQSFAYLGIDGYIVLMVRPTAIAPKMSHLNDCHREVVRVVTLVNNQSPIISLQFPLSLLMRGHVKHLSDTPLHSESIIQPPVVCKSAGNRVNKSIKGGNRPKGLVVAISANVCNSGHNVFVVQFTKSSICVVGIIHWLRGQGVDSSCLN